jgi:CMP/dCMP kinase
VVLDGRDIGTVVFPDASLKIFMDADPRVRADRRVAQLAERGVEVAIEDVLNEILARDKRDQEREHAPLRQAVDAMLLDTSELDFRNR